MRRRKRFTLAAGASAAGHRFHTMTESEIERVLAGLRPKNGQWQGRLPKSCAVFGQPIVLSIFTGTFSEAPPRPDDTELDLARLILANLETAIGAASTGYIEYHGPDFPDAPAHARSPRIEIWRDTLETEGNQRWSFFFARDDWEDGSICVEFDGLRVVTYWGGD